MLHQPRSATHVLIHFVLFVRRPPSCLNTIFGLLHSCGVVQSGCMTACSTAQFRQLSTLSARTDLPRHSHAPTFAASSSSPTRAQLQGSRASRQLPASREDATRIIHFFLSEKSLTVSNSHDTAVCKIIRLHLHSSGRYASILLCPNLRSNVESSRGYQG